MTLMVRDNIDLHSCSELCNRWGEVWSTGNVWIFDRCTSYCTRSYRDLVQ